MTNSRPAKITQSAFDEKSSFTAIIYMNFRGLMLYLRKNLTDVFDNTLDLYWDMKYSIKTRGYLQTHELKSHSASLVNARPYQGCRYRDLQKTFKHLPKSWNKESSNFIDLGSGKGRVMYMAIKHGFKNVIGMDLCSELCHQAKSNLENFSEQTTILNSDVLDIDVSLYGKDPIFFLYNSFDSLVVNTLLAKLKNQNINARFILANPRRRDDFILSDYQLVRRIRSFDFNRIIEFYEAPLSGN